MEAEQEQQAKQQQEDADQGNSVTYYRLETPRVECVCGLEFNDTRRGRSKLEAHKFLRLNHPILALARLHGRMEHKVREAIRSWSS